MRRRSSLLVSMALVAAPLAGALAIAPAGAAPLTTNPSVAATLGAHWLVTQVNAQGFIPGPTSTPNVSATLETALALAAAKTDKATFDAIVAWAVSTPNTLILSGVNDDPGRLGYLLMLAAIAKIDPTNFGGANLVTRLAGTLGGFTPGLYGAADPTYDGVFRQAIAIAGLKAVGSPVPGAAVTWLVGQQCGPIPASAAGGFLGYRPDTTVACPVPDPTGFTGPDTNSTALAVQGLAAAGRAAEATKGLDFLAAAEDGAAGFAFITGGSSDPNSEALVIQAIVAGGETPTAGRWVKGTANPYTALLAWQIGTTGVAADQGAFASPFSSNLPDLYATRQAVWGAAGANFPFAFDPYPPPVPSTTTPSTAAPTSSSTTSTAAVRAVTVTPAFTG